MAIRTVRYSSTSNSNYTIVSFKWRLEDVILLGSARHLYVICIYGAICLQIQKKFPPDPAIFHLIIKY